MQVKLVLPQSNTDEFRQYTANGRVAWNYAEHHQLLIVNCGNDGDGFSVCCSCGVIAPGDPSWLRQNHDRPFLIPNWMSASKRCNSPDGIWQGYLGHVFYSDLLMLRFQWPVGVAYQIGDSWMRDALDTIAQALLMAATRLLDISTSELQAGWSYSIVAQQTALTLTEPERVAYFFLFDTLSGGAGYATQVGLSVDKLLIETQRILDHCPDQCEQSCYRYLRSYHNRILHHRLDRNLAGTLLQAIVSGQIPEIFTIAQQVELLEILQKYLELSGNVECWHEATIQGMNVPLVVKVAQQTLAIGTYPVQQDRQIVEHPLDVLPKDQVRLFSDYQLAHDLLYAAHSLL